MATDFGFTATDSGNTPLDFGFIATDFGNTPLDFSFIATDFGNTQTDVSITQTDLSIMAIIQITAHAIRLFIRLLSVFGDRMANFILTSLLVKRGLPVR